MYNQGNIGQGHAGATTQYIQPGVPPAIQPAPNTQVIFIQAPGTQQRNVYERYPGRTSVILGIARIIAGIACIVLQSVAMGVQPSTRSYSTLVFSYIGTGIWTGVIFIVAGAFGIPAGQLKTFCLIVTNMVLAIVSVSLCGTPMFFLNIFAIVGASYAYGSSGMLALFVLLFLATLVQIISDITTSVICCKAICCCNATSDGPNSMQIVDGGQQVMMINTTTVAPQTQAGSSAYPYSPQGMHTASAPMPCASSEYSSPPAYTTHEDKQALA